MRALVIYATCEGQTQRIARHIAKCMNRSGVPTDTFDVSQHDITELAVPSYDAIVLGSSLHYAEHDPRVAWCIRAHADLLSKIPTAFFSVSLGIVSEHHQDRVEAKKLADDFLRVEKFNPSRRAYFAGALRYSKYGWLKKRMMHWIADRSGSPTVMTRDYEYTDWSEVTRFAEDFAQFIHRCRRPARVGALGAGPPTPQREYAVDTSPR